jgi:hypothetical protein
MSKEIIGNGDIAGALQDVDKDVLFFASGVSNSQETRESEYQREIDLLNEQGKDKRIVYFSSLGVLDGTSRYYLHKRTMEELVKLFPQYCIVRIGNIAWGKNPHTLINYFKDCVKNQKVFDIQDVYRYVVEKDEFLYWINMIPDFNVEINIPGKRMKVKEIFNKYVAHNYD